MKSLSLRFKAPPMLGLLLLAVGYAGAETTTATSYAGGDGTENDPYQISTLAELRRLSENVAHWAAGNHYILTADIDATDTNTWNIGNHDADDGTTPVEPMGFATIGYDTEGTRFKASLDGQGHMITNLYIFRPSKLLGLFGTVGAGGEIKNLGLVGGSITGIFQIGALVGDLRDGAIVENCYSSASVSGTSHSIGGLIGTTTLSTITSCYSTGTVNGEDYVGGLVGLNTSSTITNCYATGAVTVTDDWAGGLVGRNESAATIESSYATGPVDGNFAIGGLVGTNSGIITDSYATGDVTATNSNSGGLVGQTGTGSDITWCHATGNVDSTFYTAGGLIGGMSGGGTVADCYAEGDVTIINDNAGGLIGATAATDSITRSHASGSATGDKQIGGFIGVNLGTITSCYATGSATGNLYVGGFAGRNSFSNALITDCYATGNAIGGTNAAGFLGFDWGGDVIACYSTGAASGTDPGGFLANGTGGTFFGNYWNTETSGNATSDSGAGLTTAQMVQEASFSDTYWDFVTVPDWTIVEGLTFPYLPWQETPPAAALYPDGDGSPGDPYQISNLLELKRLSETTADWAAGTYFVLTADIDAADTANWNNGAGFSPIGEYTTPVFAGSFDGQAYVIGNLYINRPGQSRVGLFGYTSGATLANLGTEGGRIVGDDYVAGLVGNTLNTTISKCYSTSTIEMTGQYGGGLVGLLGKGSVSDCYATGAVRGATSDVGGLIGRASQASVSTSYASGNLEDSNATAGGLIGTAAATLLTNCYWDKGTTGRTTSAGGTGRTTAEMIVQSNFTGFTFDASNWSIVDGQTRPYLSYQTAALYEGSASSEAIDSFVLEAGTIRNPSGSGVTLDDYGVVYMEDGDDMENYQSAMASIAQGASASLQDFEVFSLDPGTTYWYRGYATDSLGITHFGTLRSGTTLLEPEITTWPTAEGITYGQTLADAILSGGDSTPSGTFAFESPGTVPDAGTDSYPVVFTPSDGAYGPVSSDVSVAVVQATSLISVDPTSAPITYGQTLADATLSGGTANVSGTFAFDSPATVPGAGTASYDVTFTPDDTTNYTTASTSVDVTVAKATPSINTPPTASSIMFKQTLADSTLSGGSASVAGTFAFTSPSTAPSEGTASHDVTFTPTDTANHNTAMTSVSVTVTADEAIYVDFVTGTPGGSGAENDPVDTIGTALGLVPNDGIIRINAGTGNEKITINQSVRLERNGDSGRVTVGLQ